MKTTIPPTPLYRVSRVLDALVFQSWEQMRSAERGRYDDPQDQFRVIYCSSSPIGALVETLADLRPHRRVQAAVAAIDGEDEDDLLEISRQAMTERASRRYLAEVNVLDTGPQFVDLASPITRSQLATALKKDELKIGDFTCSDRSFARLAARAVYEASYPGLVAPSAEDRHADTIAIFESGFETGTLRVRAQITRSTLIADGFRAEPVAAIGTLVSDRSTSSPEPPFSALPLASGLPQTFSA